MTNHPIESRQTEELSFSPVEVSKKCSCTSCRSYSGAYTSNFNVPDLYINIDHESTNQETKIISSDISKGNESSGSSLSESDMKVFLPKGKEWLKAYVCKISSIDSEEKLRVMEDLIKHAKSKLAAMRKFESSTSLAGSQKSVPCITRKRKRI